MQRKGPTPQSTPTLVLMGWGAIDLKETWVGGRGRRGPSGGLGLGAAGRGGGGGGGERRGRAAGGGGGELS